MNVIALPQEAAPAASISQLMLRLQHWQQHCVARLGAQASFFDFACDQVGAGLRGHAPGVDIPTAYIRTLVVALVQRIVDDKPVVLDSENDGPFPWAIELPAAPAPGRHGAVTQVIEALAPVLLDKYRHYLQVHWAAGALQLPEAEAFASVIATRLDQHMVRLDKRFATARTSARDGASLLEAIEALEQRWGQRLGWQRLATARERALVERALRTQLPDWAKLLSDLAKQEMTRHAALCRDAEQQLERALGDLVSLQAHARRLVIDYAAGHWALEVEPDAISVTTRVVMDAGDLQRIVSLSELAASGPFAASPDHLRTARGELPWVQAPLSPQQLDQLLAEVDPHKDYLQALALAYSEPVVGQLMFNLRHAQLRRSALVARCMGRLTVGLHEKVIAITEAGAQPVDNGGVVNLTAYEQVACADLLLFYTLDENGALDEMVLYAPGKPDGFEWVEVRSLAALAAEIHAWVVLDEGYEYLLGQIPEPDRAQASERFEAFRSKQDALPASRDPRGAISGYQACLAQAVRRQQSDHLAQMQLHEAPPWFARLGHDERCTLNVMSERLNLLEGHFQQQMAGQPLFADFAKRQVTQDIAGYLRARNVTEEVDPETILFDVRNELGHFELRTFNLLELAVYGHNDNWGLGNPRMRVRSSVGQDLSQLRAAELEPYLRSAYIGDKYARTLRAQFLDQGDPLYTQRRETFLAMGRLMMQRDLRVTYVKGQIDAVLYERLASVLNALGDRDTLQHGGGVAQDTGVFNLSIMDKYLVMGCYIIAHVDTHAGAPQLWVYTPQAPDGISFRDYRHFNQALSPAMRKYLLDRVELKGQANATARLAAMAQGRVDQDAVWEEFRIKHFTIEFDAYVQRYIRDVEDVTTSRGEVIERLVFQGLTFAAVPFSLIFPPLAFALDAVYLGASIEGAVEAYNAGDTRGMLLQLLGASWSTLGLLPVGGGVAKGIRALPVRSLRAAVTRGHRLGVKVSQGARASLSRVEPYPFNLQHAVARRPTRLVRIDDEASIWHGTYLRPASPTHPEPVRYLRQRGKYYRVVHDGQTLRQVHPVVPTSSAGVPVQLSEGRWVYNRVGALGGQPTPLSRVDELTAALGTPAYENGVANAVARSIVPRGAMQGEALVARFNAQAPANFLHSLNGQSCVLVSLYNPSTRVGAVLHIDHNVKPLIQQAIGDVLEKLGAPASGHRIRAVMAGGDWLTTADVGGPVRSALMRRGLVPAWDHWSYSACFGNTYGIKLDLATGVTQVYKLAKSHTANFYTPVFNAAVAREAGGMNLRVNRFFTRFRAAPPWQKPGGEVIDSVTRQPMNPRAYAKFGFEVYSL